MSVDNKEQETPQPTERSRKPEPPYCWQSKTARRIICEHFDGDSFGASCLGVYAALTEIASDEEIESFTTLQSHIAKKACLGLTTARKALKALRELGVIAYETPKLRGPIRFTLLATRRTLDATRRTFVKSQNRRSLTTVEESKKESENNLTQPLDHDPEIASNGKNSFDRFWEAYPRKVGKLKAHKAWKKHKPPIDRCLLAIEEQSNRTSGVGTPANLFHTLPHG